MLSSVVCSFLTLLRLFLIILCLPFYFQFKFRCTNTFRSSYLKICIRDLGSIPTYSHVIIFKKWVECIPMVLFAYDIKCIKISKVTVIKIVTLTTHVNKALKLRWIFFGPRFMDHIQMNSKWTIWILSPSRQNIFLGTLGLQRSHVKWFFLMYVICSGDINFAINNINNNSCKIFVLWKKLPENIQHSKKLFLWERWKAVRNHVIAVEHLLLCWFLGDVSPWFCCESVFVRSPMITLFVILFCTRRSTKKKNLYSER